MCAASWQTNQTKLMPESATHQGLVRELVSWAECNRECNGALFVDEPSRDASNKPPRINGFVPDLYWKSLNGTSILIGEAKSAYEVESRHSRKQFSSFLSHLGVVAEGTFVIAVPWHVVPQAKSLVKAIQRDTGTGHVRTVFLDYLAG